MSKHQAMIERWVTSFLLIARIPFQEVGITILKKIRGHSFGNCGGRGIGIGTPMKNALTIDICPRTADAFRAILSFRVPENRSLRELREQLLHVGDFREKFPATILERPQASLPRVLLSTPTNAPKSNRKRFDPSKPPFWLSGPMIIVDPPTYIEKVLPAKALDRGVVRVLTKARFDENTITIALLNIEGFTAGPINRNRFRRILQNAGLSEPLAKGVCCVLTRAGILATSSSRKHGPHFELGPIGFEYCRLDEEAADQKAA